MEKLAVYIALAVGTCTTNSIFIYTVGRNGHLRTTTNLILVSMAVADLFVGLFVTPTMGVFSSVLIVVDNVYVCVCLHSILLYFIIVSLCHIVLVAVERFLSFVYPVRYPAIFTHARLYKCISLCWILPLVLSISPALGWYEVPNVFTLSGNLSAEPSLDNQSYQSYEISRCQVEHIISCSYTYLVSGIVLVVFIFMTYFHVRILCVACRQLRKHRNPYNREASPRMSGWSAFKKDARAFFLVMFVVDYFLLSWSPVMALVFIGCVTGHSSVPKWMFKVFPLLAMTNSALNPIVYGLAKRDIRRHVLRALRGKKRHRHTYEFAKLGFIRRQV